MWIINCIQESATKKSACQYQIKFQSLLYRIIKVIEYLNYLLKMSGIWLYIMNNIVNDEDK